MKLLALAAVMMVSGTMVGQQIDPNKADDKPSYFVFSNMPGPADVPKNAHEWAMQVFQQYKDYHKSQGHNFHSDSITMFQIINGDLRQQILLDWDGKVDLRGITLDDAMLSVLAFQTQESLDREKEWDRQEKVREEESQHNPPPSLKAGSGKYKITPVHQLPADVLANTQCTTKQINVLIEQDAKRTSVMHEMMHVASNCDESVHRAIYELARPLLKLLQDNPDMADYLLKRTKPAAPPVAKPVASPADHNTPSVTLFSDIEDAVLPQAPKCAWEDNECWKRLTGQMCESDNCDIPTKLPIYASEGQEVLHSDSNKVVSVGKGGYPDAPFDFNSPGPIAWKDPYYVKYASGWMCTRELVEKRDTICFRMLESFHWAAFDCTKDSVVCRDVKSGAK